MGEARSGISLDELGITDTKIRKAQTDGLLVEISGESVSPKDDSLDQTPFSKIERELELCVL